MKKIEIETKTTICKYGTKTLTLTIENKNEWNGGEHSRTYLDISDIDKMFEVKNIFIDNSNTAKIKAYDQEIETDSGHVIIECREKMSGKKTGALESAICELLDD